MPLSDIPLRLSYRTGRDHLVQDFFNPCLEAAVLYRRAAGYFTSAGLALAARGVAHLASRRGKMQLVVSPYLEPDDVAALQTAADHPTEALRAIATRSLAEIEDTNPRQFIQRRGRLLRNAPGKTRALIYDFIIRPPDLGGSLDDDAFNLERTFFQRELRRIVEFCRTAENGPEALHSLHDMRVMYNLLSD